MWERKRRPRWLTAAVLALGITAGGGPPAAQDEPARRSGPPQNSSADPFQEIVRPLLETHCGECHGRSDPEAGLNLSALLAEEDVRKEIATWQRIWEVIYRQEMPPEPPHLTRRQREQLSGTIGRLLDRAAAESGSSDGQVILRRLNQVEYNNTVLDMFGVHRATSYYDPERGMPEQVRIIPFRDYRRTVVPLPPDDIGYGFTNIGEVLSLPPFLMEKYLAASRRMIDLLSDDPRSRRRPEQTRNAELSRNADAAAEDPTHAFMRRVARSYQATPNDAREGAEKVVAGLGRRAFRRSLTPEELQRYLSLYDTAAERGEPFEEALQGPIQAMLASPHFLFRVELGIESEQRGDLRPLSDHELATRLSYFLWSSMPDPELLRLADQGRLRDPDVLEAQTRRMLRHRFSKSLGEQFGLQWLNLTGIRSAMPFPDQFPQFYKLKYLPESFQFEALLLFETILVEDRSVREFIDPEFTWLNATLRSFYDLADEEDSEPRGSSHLEWQRRQIHDKRRGGIVAMGGTLLATSLATRSSPVLRGQWVLETLLGTPAPPPPPNVDNILDGPVAEDHLSFRERLARHRADPACASCHRRMDPIGFGLDNYDAIGAWRGDVDGEPIDAEGQLPDGTRFNGPVELKEILVTDRHEDFLRCLSEKMMTYALGRKLTYADAPAIDEIVRQLRDEDRFSALVVGIVRSEPFRYINARAFSNRGVEEDE